MSNADKLKRKAAEFEQKKQFDRALEVYVQVLDKEDGSAEERDVPLYNRVGDLHLRLGDTEKAVNYYEQAVDLYTEGGYLNNAIALCNKILRHAPGRPPDLLQAREDLRQEGLQQRREEELPRVRRSDAEAGEDG